MARYIIHDLQYSSYYCGGISSTGFCNSRSKAYVFITIGEAKAALAALKKSNPSGNRGCIFEKL